MEPGLYGLRNRLKNPDRLAENFSEVYPKGPSELTLVCLPLGITYRVSVRAASAEEGEQADTSQQHGDAGLGDHGDDAGQGIELRRLAGTQAAEGQVGEVSGVALKVKNFHRGVLGEGLGPVEEKIEGSSKAQVLGARPANRKIKGIQAERTEGEFKVGYRGAP